MLSALGDWLFLPTLLLALVGFAAGVGMLSALPGLAEALPHAHEARRPGDRRAPAVVWRAWAGCLLAVPLLPVSAAAWVAVVVRLPDLGPGVRLLVALPLGALVVPLIAVPVVLLLAVLDRWETAAVAVGLPAYLCFAFAAGWGVWPWLLEWRGSQTVCTVLNGEERSTPDPAGGQLWSYTYTLDCEAPGAPGRMHTMAPVAGPRVTVVYDPSGLAGVVPEGELDHLPLTTWAAGGSLAVWLVAGSGSVLSAMPLARNPNAWP